MGPDATGWDWGETGARVAGVGRGAGLGWWDWAGVGREGAGREWWREWAVLLCPDHVLIVSQSCCDGVPVLF